MWIYTPGWKKAIRTMIGMTVAFFTIQFFLWAVEKTDDVATKFFFGRAVPEFCVAFFIFGFFPIICKWTYLVLKVD